MKLSAEIEARLMELTGTLDDVRALVADVLDAERHECRLAFILNHMDAAARFMGKRIGRERAETKEGE